MEVVSVRGFNGRRGWQTGSIEPSGTGLAKFVDGRPQIFTRLRLDDTGILCEGMKGINGKFEVVVGEVNCLDGLGFVGSNFWWRSDDG